MKKIEAYVRPEKLQRVKEALDAIGVKSLSVYDVRGRGAQGGIKLAGRVGEYVVDFIDKLKLELFINCGTDIEAVITAIADAARSEPNGRPGDGKIFISDVQDAIRIRDLERGEAIC
jgi:nitrogen regulatory protein P-II 1